MHKVGSFVFWKTSELLYLITNHEKMNIEPKIYAVLVKSNRGQFLHIGAHHSLDEAYSRARSAMEGFIPHDKGESIDLDLWNTVSTDKLSKNIDQELGEITKIGNVIPLTGNNIPPILRAILGGLPLDEESQFPESHKHTIDDYVQDFKSSKNTLMKELIKAGDVTKVEKVKELLGTNARRYVLKAIEKKKPVDTTFLGDPKKLVDGNSEQE